MPLTLNIFLMPLIIKKKEMCPKGNDPMTPSNGYDTVMLRTLATAGTMAGQFRLSFNGESFFFPATVGSWNGTQCQNSFATLPNIKSVICAHNGTDVTGGGTAYTVKLTAFPRRPYENNVYTNDGKVTARQFSCDTTLVTGATGVVFYIEPSPSGTSIPGKSLMFILFCLINTFLSILLFLLLSNSC